MGEEVWERWTEEKEESWCHIVEEKIICNLDEDEEMYTFDDYDSADYNKFDKRLIYYD